MTLHLLMRHISKYRNVVGHLPPQPYRLASHQANLPHLPVPPLQQTLQKYKDAVEPLVDASEFEHTEKVVDEFGKTSGLGDKLQESLVSRSKKVENWLSDWWRDVAYLNVRGPVTVHVSPSVSFPRYPFRGIGGQVEHAAKVISAVLDFKIDVDNETIKIDKMGKNDLCMDQYYKILSSCRIPGIKRDDAKTYADSWLTSQHVVVAHNNQFFQLNVYHGDDQPLSIRQLEDQLHRIVQASPTRGTSVGVLTSDARNSWGKAYTELSRDYTNRQSFKSIQRSIFMICLDGSVPTVTDDNWRSNLALRVLHGGTDELNKANRWYDKTLQFVVCPDGGVGICYEHVLAEGPPIAALLDHVYKYCEELPSVQPKPSMMQLPAPNKLQFNVSNSVKDAIETATMNLHALSSDIMLKVLEFNEFGKNYPKSQNISPDAFIQVALQLAYYRLHGKSCATYESASLRKFKFGRTDTIRSCSKKSLAFTKAMDDFNVNAADKVVLFREATTAHRQYTTDAINGEAIDRHLLGLKLTALELKQDIPKIFMDTTYNKALHYNLSTSQVPCQADLCMAFGPAVPDGYGICYNPKEERMLFSISTFKSNPDTKNNEFVTVLERCLLDIRDLLLHANTKSKL